MGKNFAHSVKHFALAGSIAILAISPLHAQIAPGTGPTDTLELPEIGLEGSEACDNSANGMNQQLSNAGNFTVNQEFLVTQGYLRQPPSYFQCLQPMIQAANSVVNAFNGTLSISSVLNTLLSSAIKSLLQNLEALACASLQNIVGYAQLSNSYLPNSSNPATAISGASQGTSVSNMVGNAPNAVAPTAALTPSGAQPADAQSGSMVMAQETLGSSVSDLNTPPPPPDSQRYGPNTPSGYSFSNLPTQPSVAYDDWKTDAASTAPDPPTAPPAPAPPPFTTPALPASPAPPSPPSGTSTHGGIMAKNYQNVQIGRVYGKELQCVQMFRSPSPPSLGSLGPFGAYPTRAPISAGAQVEGLTDLAPGVIVATFLGPGRNFNTQQIYGYQHIAMYKSQNGSGMSILNQYRHSGGAKLDFLQWHSGRTPDWHADAYYVAQ